MRVVYSLILLLFSLLLAEVVSPLCLFDFTLYRMSAVYFFKGMNPYELPHFSTFITDVPTTWIVDPKSPQITAATSPLTFPLLFLFTLFPLSLAKYLFSVLFFMAVAWIAYRSHLLLLSFYQCPSQRGQFFLILLCSYGLCKTSLYWGGVGWICAVGVSEFLFQLYRKRYLASGISLGLCMVKPHLVLVFGIVWFLTWLHEERCVALKVTAGASAVVIAFALLVISVSATVFLEYKAYLDTNSLVSYMTSSLPSILYQLLPAEPGLIFRILPVIVVGLLLTVWRRTKSTISSLYFLICILPWTVLFSPYAWGHDCLLCIPTIGLLIALTCRHLLKRKLLIATLIGGPLFLATTTSLLLSHYLPDAGALWILYGLGLVVSSFFAIDRGGEAQELCE
jgi:hypothetical protein